MVQPSWEGQLPSPFERGRWPACEGTGGAMPSASSSLVVFPACSVGIAKSVEEPAVTDGSRRVPITCEDSAVVGSIHGPLPFRLRIFFVWVASFSFSTVASGPGAFGASLVGGAGNFISSTTAAGNHWLAFVGSPTLYPLKSPFSSICVRTTTSPRTKGMWLLGQSGSFDSGGV